ncbi:hypothetical protein B0H13DRAFT_691059 [Mycena leptocephala]|nr:hypothetical protein B0H13DRAFT_691059 [Mycena leptocephala]
MGVYDYEESRSSEDQASPRSTSTSTDAWHSQDSANLDSPHSQDSADAWPEWSAPAWAAHRFDEDERWEGACDGVQDVVFAGETDPRHGAAWHHYGYSGRVRPWDGLIGLVMRPRDRALGLATQLSSSRGTSSRGTGSGDVADGRAGREHLSGEGGGLVRARRPSICVLFDDRDGSFLDARAPDLRRPQRRQTSCWNVHTARPLLDAQHHRRHCATIKLTRHTKIRSTTPTSHPSPDRPHIRARATPYSHPKMYTAYHLRARPLLFLA